MKKSTLCYLGLVFALALVTAPTYSHQCMTCESFNNTQRIAAQNLAALQGCWLGSSTSGVASEVSYEMGSDGTSLLEIQWVEGYSPVYTIYYMDGTGVAAHHFCSMGNQIRMKGTEAADGSYIDFRFLDATNMQSANQPHMTGTKVTFDDPNNITVEWSSFCDDGTGVQVTQFTYTRAIAGCNVGQAKRWSER